MLPLASVMRRRTCPEKGIGCANDQRRTYSSRSLWSHARARIQRPASWVPMRTMPLPRHMKRCVVGLATPCGAMGEMVGSFIYVRFIAKKARKIVAGAHAPDSETILRRRDRQVVRRSAPRMSGWTWADQPRFRSAASPAMMSLAALLSGEDQGSGERT